MPNPVSALNKIKNMFSPLERTIIAHKMETMPSSQWAAYIKANAPKAAKKEALAIKLDELLARQSKVSKADIVKHIQEKSPKVNVIEKGDMKLNAAESKELDELKQKASKYMFGDDAAITDDEFLRYNALASRYDNSTVSGLNQKSESYFNSARKAKEKGNWSDELFDNRQGEFYKRRADALNAAPVDGNKTKFDTYTLPGGENYKEVILSLPQKPMSFEEWHNYNMPGARNPERYREDYERYLANPDVMSPKETFRSGHYEEPNILAHLRMNERPTAEGKRALFLEELQSDWAQQGRKEGFLTPDLHVERRAQLNAEKDALAKEATAMRERGESPVDIRARMRQLDDALRDIPTPKGVPAGPYVGDTADWTALGLKKAIERAVEQGHDSIAWTSGAQQAKRYDLSKDINEVHYSGSNLKAYDHDGNEVVSQTGISPEDLPEYIGKDAAEKLLAQQPQGTLRSLRGQDLQVGGEGMRGYYDQIVPSTANDILKSMGVTERVKPIYMNKELQSPRAGTNYEIVDNTGRLHNTERYPEDAQKYIDQQMSNPLFVERNKGLTLSINPIEAKYKYTDPQMGFDITPEIRDYVMNQGLPAFAGGGVVKGAANLAKKYLTPLSEKEFYKTYVAQHKDIRNVTPEDRAAAAQAILESGFNKGVNVNALPVDRGGPARNVIDKRYGNKAGDRVYLLPKEGVLEGGNGLITAEGYKPTPMQVLDISVDREPSYEAYLRNFTKEYAGGGIVKAGLSPLAKLIAEKSAKIRAAGYSETPWFHGTNKEVILDERPIWLGDPNVASGYIGGGRRSKVERGLSGGKLYPFMVKQDPKLLDVNLAESTSDSKAEWLRQLGIDPEALMQYVEPRAKLDAEKYFAEQDFLKGNDLRPIWSRLGSVGVGSSRFQESLPNNIYEVLDRPHVISGMMEQWQDPTKTFIFQHPAWNFTVSKKGKPKYEKVPDETQPVLWAPNAAASLKSPFEFKQGGAVNMDEGDEVNMAGGGIVRSGIKDLMDLVSKYNGKYAARRVERAADEVPNLEQQYTKNALKNAFTGDNATGVMVMRPKYFEEYAEPLPPPYLQGVEYKRSPITGEYVTYEKYINDLANHIEGMGASEVPYLELERTANDGVRISGHEGRHRMRALNQLGDQTSLVRMLPGKGMRERFPRGSQEEYIDALNADLGLDPTVSPEVFPDVKLALPKIFKEGGAVHMDEGGLNVRASGNYGRFDSENASGSHYKVNTDIDILNKYGFGVTKEGDVFKLPERTYTYEDGYTETVPARKFKQSNINDIRARYTTDEGVQYGVGRQPLAKGWSGYRFDPSSQSTIGVNVSPYYKGINYTKNFAEGGKVSDSFANLSMMDKAKLLAKAAKYRIQYNKQAVEHGKYPDALSSELKKNYLDQVGNSRVNRSPLDAALNYGGGYDFGVRQDIPADVARDMGKAYQYTDYFFSPFTGPKSDAVGDYYENMAGVEAGIKERGRRATEAEIQRRSAEYGRGASKMLPQYEEPEYAEGGAVETDDFDYDEMYEFKKDEPAFAEGGEVDYDAMYEFKDNTVGFAKGGPVLSVGRGEKLPVSKGAGLTAKGRAKYNAATGSNLKAPAPHPKTDADAGRRKSFCARMSGMPGPMKDEQGNPTRKAASLKRWNC